MKNNFVIPEVTVLAETRLSSPQNNHIEEMEVDLKEVRDIDALTEYAGRACYQSFSKPNPKTANNDGYLNNIINQGHFSVIEHGSVSFLIKGVSRSCTHEIVRHRHFSYSQYSQRFIDESNANFVLPPAMWLLDEEISDEYIDSVKNEYSKIVDSLEKAGLKRKEVREAARCVLPNCTETRLVMTGNITAWRNFLARRLSPSADREIQFLSHKILDELREIVPNAMQDFDEETYPKPEWMKELETIYSQNKR